MLAMWLFGKPSSWTSEHRMAASGVDAESHIQAHWDNGQSADLLCSVSTSLIPSKSIISGSDLSEANIANFQAKRDVWYANYQLHHEKGVGYGYANTFNAQAKVGFQIRVFAEKGEPFDPDRTVYNKDYLLEILDRGKTSLDEMKAAGQL